MLAWSVVATPLAAMSVGAWEKTNRPAHLMAESSGRSATELHEEQKYLFKRHGRLDIVTGRVFTTVSTTIYQHGPPIHGAYRSRRLRYPRAKTMASTRPEFACAGRVSVTERCSPNRKRGYGEVVRRDARVTTTNRRLTPAEIVNIIIMLFEDAVWILQMPPGRWFAPPLLLP